MSLLLRVVPGLTLAVAGFVCARYPQLIPPLVSDLVAWLLLGLYVFLAFRRRNQRRIERRREVQHTQPLAHAEAAQDEAYRRWRRERGLELVASGAAPDDAPPAALPHAEQRGLGPRARPVRQARRWH